MRGQRSISLELAIWKDRRLLLIQGSLGQARINSPPGKVAPEANWRTEALGEKGGRGGGHPKTAAAG